MKSPVFDESVVENPRGYPFDVHTLWEGVDIDTENTDTCDYEERSVYNGSPEKAAHAILKKIERILAHFVPQSHWNVTFRKEDFAKQLVFVAFSGDFISNGSRSYKMLCSLLGFFFSESTPISGKAVLYHMHKLSMEDVQNLYENANRYLLKLAKKHKILKRVNVQLVVDFVGKKFYGKHRDLWVWKKKEEKKWVHLYEWIEVSLVDKDFKYPIYVEAAPASCARAKEMAELLIAVLEKTYAFYEIFSAKIYVDRGFYNVEVINGLDDFCKRHRSQWLMPAIQNKRVKKKLELGEEMVYSHSMQNKKRKRACFPLVTALNEKGELRPFATNITVEPLGKLFTFYRRRWQIETNNRSEKHPFLINTTSVHMPTRDYLMRLACIFCFAWMILNNVLIKDGFDHWITIHTFIMVLFFLECVRDPQALEYTFSKAPASARTAERKLSLICLILFFEP